jgi:hypothetical protein
MATETGRHRLYEKIRTEWGEEHAIELMSYLPPVGWADVATKHDLRSEIALVRADLRTEMADLRTDLGREMADLRTDVRGEIAELGSRLDRSYNSLLRWTVGTLVAMTGIFAIFVGVVR